MPFSDSGESRWCEVIGARALPRLARVDVPDIVHHIMIKGIERRNIFRDARDREDFLERLGNLRLEIKTPCYA
jgi:hypothetical protein